MIRTFRGSAAALVAVLASGTVGAVGLGPLSKAGVTDGPAKAFYLTLFNPYPARTSFVIYAVGNDDEERQGRVHVPVAPMPLAGQTSRKFMIYADGLTPGETYAFRVCAEKADNQESEIHARVCSRITARRLVAGG